MQNKRYYIILYYYYIVLGFRVNYKDFRSEGQIPKYVPGGKASLSFFLFKQQYIAEFLRSSLISLNQVNVKGELTIDFFFSVGD